nr:hypothetical protein [Tanacetum cinerariifolium]
MIRRHLIKHGFDKNYTCWDLHGMIREPQVDSQTFVSDTNHEENDSNDDNLDEMLHDVQNVIQLGYRPRRVLQYQGCDINRYTFYTKKQDNKSIVQNSGVALIATTTYSSRKTIVKNSYYGVVEDIRELDYTLFVIPLLKCKWVNNTRGVKVDSNGLTCVNLSTNGYLSDPFILAKQATQVFNVEYPKDKRWHIVLQSKRSIIAVDDVVEKDEYNKFDELPPFSIGVQSTNDVLSDTLYLRSNHQEGHED